MEIPVDCDGFDEAVGSAVASTAAAAVAEKALAGYSHRRTAIGALEVVHYLVTNVAIPHTLMLLLRFRLVRGPIERNRLMIPECRHPNWESQSAYMVRERCYCCC